MSEIPAPARRRADAQRSISAILDAAIDVLADRREASMSEIAAAAGVARQTVYAHYPSRDALLMAVAERTLAQTLAAMDAADLGAGPPAEALDRLVTAWWGSVAPHARVLEALGAALPTAHSVHDFHQPVLDRLASLVARGQKARAFDRDASAPWLTATFLGLMHTAAEEVAAGRLDVGTAGAELARTVPRVFGTR
jgi:AcrR family transcriptional regulator